ncbi:MAG: hypothetical protein JW798_13695 [Prolixibacteraceae bacterium]|nr:hypothetical protein [Prolixibacteraceae bacterium]
MKTQFILFVTAAIFSLQFFGSNNFAATTVSSDASASNSIYTEAEEELVIEDWMTNDALWGIAPENEFDFDSTVVGEEELVIEDWMTDDELWRL